MFLSFKTFATSMQPGDPEFDFVKNHLQHVVRSDPPFFKIKHKNNSNIERELYILGSLHNKHPDILLPLDVLNEVNRLNPTAIYFTEHTSTTPNQGMITLQQIFTNIDSSSPNRWDPVALFNLNTDQQRIWDSAKIIPIPLINGMTLEWIQKIDTAQGVIIFHQFIPKISELKGKRTVNFEKVLKDKGWSSLENLELFTDAIQAIGLVQADQEKFFTNSLKSVEKIESYALQIQSKNEQVAFQMTADEYEVSLRSYKYNCVARNVKDSTKERNREWEKTLIDYLDRNSSQDPLLIVVGNAHLSGGITEGSYSFLEYLSKIKGVSPVQRMDSAGVWINI